MYTYTFNQSNFAVCSLFPQGYRQRQCFITTQGPMKNTAGDFWRMIWEYNCNAIVMLTQLEEHGVVGTSHAHTVARACTCA